MSQSLVSITDTTPSPPQPKPTQTMMLHKVQPNFWVCNCIGGRRLWQRKYSSSGFARMHLWAQVQLQSSESYRGDGTPVTKWAKWQSGQGLKRGAKCKEDWWPPSVPRVSDHQKSGSLWREIGLDKVDGITLMTQKTNQKSVPRWWLWKEMQRYEIDRGPSCISCVICYLVEVKKWIKGPWCQVRWPRNRDSVDGIG